MLTLNGFSAWIAIEGTVVKEYGVEVVGEEVRCWIPSETDKTFQVHWEDKSFASPTRGRVRIDGQRCGSKIIQSKRQAHVQKRGFRTSVTGERPFLFSKLKVTDDETLVSATTSTPGTIELTIARVSIISIGEFKKARALPSEKVYDEKAKKGFDHGIGFGTQVEGRPVKEVYLKNHGNTIVKFCFRYTSLDMILAKGLAPADNPSRARSSTASTGIAKYGEDDASETKQRPRHRSLTRAEPETVKLEPTASKEIIDLTI